MMKDNGLELYIHIPFCAQKCLYCDFLSFRAPVKTYQEYTRQLVTEIRTQGTCFADRRVTSIFVGGGTPSILPAELMREILTAVREAFAVEPDAEITLEANPGTLTPDRVSLYREQGVNRLSLGLQSADDRELRRLGRIHSFDEFLKSYQAARLAGFDNINVDLMSALPGQTVASWRNTLRKVLMLRPEHISAYSLIIEEGTPFYDHYGGKASPVPGDGWLPLPDEDTDREIYHLTKTMLAEHGYSRYEISNYARPGRECRHNVGYWTGVDYLGLGLGASSYIGGYRYHNTENMQEYMSLDLEIPGEAAREIEEMTLNDRMEEFMFLGLRMTKGVSGSEFLERFGENMWNVYAEVLPKLLDQGLIEMEAPYVRLTDYGTDVSNVVFREMLLD